jgi:hypothetical protein
MKVAGEQDFERQLRINSNRAAEPLLYDAPIDDLATNGISPADVNELRKFLKLNPAKMMDESTTAEYVQRRLRKFFGSDNVLKMTAVAKRIYRHSEDYVPKPQSPRVSSDRDSAVLSRGDSLRDYVSTDFLPAQIEFNT